MKPGLLFIFTIIGLLLGGRPLHAQNESILTFEIKLEDNPLQAHLWALEQLNRVDRKKDPARYLRMLWLAFQVNHPSSKELIPLIPGALDQAEKLGLKEEWFRLKMHAARIERVQKKVGKDVSYFETLIAEGRRLDLPRLLARILFDYAFYLDAKGDLNASLRHQEEAYQLLLTKPMSAFDQALLKNEMAILLIQQGQSEKALPMMLAVAEYCEKEEVRAFAAVALYNLARQYELKQTPADAIRARPWFQKAYLAAQAIGDEESRASALYGLGSTALTMKDWALADRNLQSALTLFQKQEDPRWIVEALILLARSARLQNRALDAVKFLQQAESQLITDDRRLKNKFNEEMALALRAAGNFAKATDYLYATLEAARQIFEEQQKDDYQRRTVQLGLRVEEERNKVLQRENELQAQKLKQAQTYRLYFFVLSILLLGLVAFIVVAIVQTLRVRRSEVKMREILDHIEEGILTVDRNLHIEAGYSSYLKEFTQIDTPLQGQSILPTLIDRSALHAEEKSMLREVLQLSLGEERLSWELNEGQLPRQLHFASEKDRIAALHWVPMFDSRGILQRILLTLRDVTEERRLSARIEAQEEREKNLQIKMRELLEAPIPSVLALLNEIREAAPSPTRRQLHTFKGVARSLGLKSLSQVIHDLESAMDDLTLQKQFMTHGEQYRLLISDHPQARHQKNLAAVVAELLPAFLEQMQKAGCAVHSCTIDDQVLQWPERLLPDLKNILVHVLSNCADHGYIKPLSPTPARLHIQAIRQEALIELHIRDNGAGLNEKILAEAARSRHFQPGPGATLFDVVFLEGFSTAAQADLTSGRGVGLAAVASICQAWQGQAHIEPDSEAGGTHMALSFKSSA